MAKAKRKFVCQQCGTVTSRWQGQCEDCGEWNSIVEEAAETVFSAKHDLQGGGRAITLIGLDSKVELPARTSTGIAEFDRALGGGIVPGSATLIGGDPGIGKSTLLLQAAARGRHKRRRRRPRRFVGRRPRRLPSRTNPSVRPPGPLRRRLQARTPPARGRAPRNGAGNPPVGPLQHPRPRPCDPCPRAPLPGSRGRSRCRRRGLAATCRPRRVAPRGRGSV